MGTLQKIKSPVGELEWVIITGEGKENLSGVMQYKADLVLEGEPAEKLKAEIQAFWEANRPKGIVEPKSLGFYDHQIPTGEKDEETGKNIYEKTGKTMFSFKTATTFGDGKPKVVQVFNASGARINLGEQTIGNGSRGRIDGAIDIYEVRGKGKNAAIVDAGVTLFLNAIQLSKFVPYVGGPNFDAIDGEDPELSDGMEALQVETSAKESDPKERPRL
jgi:hypothetical protein